MKKQLLLLALSSTLLLTNSYAKATKAELVQNQTKKHQSDLKNTPKEVIEALANTYKAVALIKANKIDEAKKILTQADKKFQEALKKNPKLDLLPVDEGIMIFQFAGDSKTIQKALDLSSTLIKKHATQDAREILMPLKDEMDIDIVAIPMKLYPKTTKKALEALNKGDKDSALLALGEGFGTLVITKTVIPLPLLAAQDLVIGASNLDKNKKDKALKLLALAKEELKRAELLGYTQKHSKTYKLLNDDISNIEKEIKGKNEVEKFYKKIKEDFKAFLNKIDLEKVKINNPAERKVIQYQKEQQLKAIKEKSIFSKEAKEDLNKTVK